MPLFETPEDLLHFFNNIDLDKSNIVFTESMADETKQRIAAAAAAAMSTVSPAATALSAGANITETPIVPTDVLIESFSESPTYDLTVVEGGKSIFYVKGYSVVENYCGSGKITLSDRETHINMCESGGEAVVNLDVTIGDKRINNIPMVLAVTDGEPYLEISTAVLN